MYREITRESTDTEEEAYTNLDQPIQEVSFGSIKTQDSIERNSLLPNLDDEEYKETESEFRNLDQKETRRILTPALSYKEAHQAILLSLSGPKVRAEIKSLSEISKNLHKICENFQMWRKLD